MKDEGIHLKVPVTVASRVTEDEEKARIEEMAGDWEIPSDALIPWQQWVELCGLERIAKHLLPTVSRLRGNESGFPKKYQHLWDDVRGAYLSRLQSQFSISKVPEQIHKLEAMYNQLETAFYRSQESPGEMARLSNAMLKVLSAIHVLAGR